ncbi:type II secretion system F family protein [Corynebacterium sp. CCM 9185]|uniref:Type II secretion system F family protein n=1 Tax=Corynebacterium marambiense TaxID=2765364 RepID=A0ABS0VTH9_9CORY|nr:type II secretion system F family protein [Corynebacterium marambiense]MBI8999614.1 type II secretion system F family protein [Corynebacterium marambiense]MCK7662452.1 type II secretion system F family protein [Corynebacterium marambiense]
MIPLILLAAACLLGPPAPGSRIHPAVPGRPNRRLPRIVFPLTGIPLVFLVPPTVLLSGVAVAGTCAWWIRDARRHRHAACVADATADILGRIVADLHAGASMAGAVQSAVASQRENAATPVSVIDTLQTAARRAADGPGAALILAEAHGLPDLAAMGRLWHLSERHGIPLATVLEQAQRRIDARIRHRNRTRAALQGPQASAVILTLLPPVGMLMGALLGAEPLAVLTGGGVGGLLLLGGVLLTCAGLVISRIIVLRAAGDAA